MHGNIEIWTLDDMILQLKVVVQRIYLNIKRQGV